MKRAVVWSSAAVFVLAVGAVLFARIGEDKKGMVTFADGQVKRQAMQKEDWVNAPINTEVISGDKVRTYQQSRAEVDLAKLDVIRLAPKTIVFLDKLYEETKDKKMQTSVKLEEGELWAAVHQIEPTTQFDLSAPIAAAAITGTVLRMNVGDDSTTQLKVYEGEVKLKPQRVAPPTAVQSLKPQQIPGPGQVPGPREVSVEEWIQIVKAMQQVTVNSKGQIVSSGSFSNKDADENTSWVEWNKRRDALRFKRIRPRQE